MLYWVSIRPEQGQSTVPIPRARIVPEYNNKSRIWTVNCPYSLVFEGSSSGQNCACTASCASNVSNASEARITYLELRSPMFGETCMSMFRFEFDVIFSFYVVFPQRCRQKWNLRGLFFFGKATLWNCALTGLECGCQKVSIKSTKYLQFGCSGLPMQLFVSLGPVFVFCQKDSNPLLKTKNSREKLTFAGAETHLELCSPMFGETCISIFMCDFQWN